MYKLKSVNTLLRTGKDFVRNNLSTSAAQHIIDCGELVESDNPEYPICVDKKWYFEGVEIPENPPDAPKSGRKGGRKA